ncbi:MAG: ABC transporter permease [Euryarchaeota archaeon]|nr:ABC transporter permease [Euryarchaeota archaeon]
MNGQHLDLIYELTMAELRIRYKNSALGFVWSLLEPLLVFTILYVVFSQIMRGLEETERFYQLYLLLGIILWRLFEIGTSLSVVSLTGRPWLVQHVYVPRQYIVAATCLSALVTALLELGILFVFVFALGAGGLVSALAPLFVLFLFAFTLGVSLMVAALNVYFRDIQHIWRVVLQAGFFATPILYPLEFVPVSVRWVLELNPLTHLFTALRDVILHGTVPAVLEVALMMFIAIGTLVIGYALFREFEPRMAEEV